MPNRLRILLCEDSSSDTKLALRAIRECGVPASVHSVWNGEECMAYLHALKASHSPFPDLLLLDLRMPRMGGLDVLDAIHADEDLRCIIVVVFTSSLLTDDIRNAYRGCISAYLCKPLGRRAYVELFQETLSFYSNRVARP